MWQAREDRLSYFSPVCSRSSGLFPPAAREPTLAPQAPRPILRESHRGVDGTSAAFAEGGRYPPRTARTTSPCALTTLRRLHGASRRPPHARLSSRWSTTTPSRAGGCIGCCRRAPSTTTSPRGPRAPSPRPPSNSRTPSEIRATTARDRPARLWRPRLRRHRVRARHRSARDSRRTLLGRHRSCGRRATFLPQGSLHWRRRTLKPPVPAERTSHGRTVASRPQGTLPARRWPARCRSICRRSGSVPTASSRTSGT